MESHMNDDHETESAERWPDDVLADDHPTEPVERWPDEFLTEDHPDVLE
jgi:hypothetical protein